MDTENVEMGLSLQLMMVKREKTSMYIHHQYKKLQFCVMNFRRDLLSEILSSCTITLFQREGNKQL